MPRWVDACRWEDIPEGRAVGVDIDGLGIAIYRYEDRPFALLDRCPHAGGSMASGWVEDSEAICPLHRWRFKLASGRCVSGGGSLHRFKCEVGEDGAVRVQVG